MNNKTHSGDVLYVLHGFSHKTLNLGLYSTFNGAYDAMQDYFEKTRDEAGTGLYQFDTYTIFSQEVDLAVDYWRDISELESYKADYVTGTLKQMIG